MVIDTGAEIDEVSTLVSEGGNSDDNNNKLLFYIDTETSIHKETSYSYGSQDLCRRGVHNEFVVK